MATVIRVAVTLRGRHAFIRQEDILELERALTVADTQKHRYCLLGHLTYRASGRPGWAVDGTLPAVLS